MGRRWDAICSRCGLCCMEKTVSGDRIVYHMDRPCLYLGVESFLCRIYETRFRDCSHCRKMTLYKVMFASYLPDSCSYVRWAKRLGIRFAAPRQEIYSEGSEDDEGWHDWC